MLPQRSNHPPSTLRHDPALLIKAASEGNLKTKPVHRLLLVAGPTIINARDSIGDTALIAAARNGHSNIVKWLIAHNAEVNAINNRGDSALTVAAAGSHFLIAQELINYHAEVNIRDKEGYTPLMRAFTAGGDDQIILNLIEKKADVNTPDTYGYTPLISAIVHRRDAKIIQALIEKKADVNVRDKEGGNALMRAIVHGCDAKIVNRLLENKAEANITDKQGNTLLMRAVLRGYGRDAQVIQKIIEQKVDINAKDEKGNTPLMRATMIGDSLTVQNLANNGADVNTMDKKGYTALMIAALNGSFRIVKSLLEKKATINAQNKNGGNALFMAAHPNLAKLTAPRAHFENKHNDNNRLPIIELLLEAGAEGLEHKKNLTEIADHVLTGWRRLVADGNESPDYKARMDRTDYALTLLTKAASKGDITTVQRLLKAGININAHNEFGETALMVAAGNNHRSTVELLLDNKAKIDEPCEVFAPSLKAFERFAFTPLMAAAFSGHPGMVELLLTHKARTDKPSKYGNTPLMTAILGGNLETIQLLLDKNAKVTTNAKNDQGITALMLAAMHTPEAVKLLLEKGAEVNLMNQSKTTALMYAAYFHHPQAVELLIEKKANVNATDENGATALFFAARSASPSQGAAVPANNLETPNEKTQGSKDVRENKEKKDNPDTNQDDNRFSTVKLLIKAKANPEAKNKDNETPLTSPDPTVRNFLQTVCQLKLWQIWLFFENTPQARALLLESDLLPTDSLIEICTFLAPEEYDEKAFYQIAKEVIKELQPKHEAKAPAKNSEKTIKPNPALKEEKNDSEKDPEVKTVAAIPAENLENPSQASKEIYENGENKTGTNQRIKSLAESAETLGNIADPLKGLNDNLVPHDEKNVSKENQGVEHSAETTEEKRLANDSLPHQTPVDLAGNSKILSEGKAKPNDEKSKSAWRTEQEALVRHLSGLPPQTSFLQWFNPFLNKSSEEGAFQEAKTETELTQLLLNQFHRAAHTQEDKRDLKAVCDNLPKLSARLDSNSVEALQSICLAIIKNPTLDPFNKKRLEILFKTLFTLLSPDQDKSKKYTSGGGSRS